MSSTTTNYPNLTLYRSNGSCSFASHMVLHELGIPFNEVLMAFDPVANAVAPADGSLTPDEYKAQIHPHGYVPALKVIDPDTQQAVIITENTAILSYIGSLNTTGPKNLLGKTPLERGQVISWLSWLSSYLHGTGYGGLWRPRRFIDETAFDGEAGKEVQKHGRQTIDKAHELLETRHADDGSGYALGQKVGLTLVDFYLYVFFIWGYTIGINDLAERFPKFARVARTVEGTHGAKKAIAIEGTRDKIAGSAWVIRD